MNYIVNSFGGSGSWMLVNYLKQFGNTYHIHQRNLPKRLTYPDPDPKKEKLSFQEIPLGELNNYKVIFIYRNPINAIYSRFDSKYHLLNIDSPTLDYESVYKTLGDVFRIGEFYKNQFTSEGRNYKVYCVRYEDIFIRINEFNKVLGISPPKEKILIPVRNETLRVQREYAHLWKIYKELIEDMLKKEFITVI